MSKYGPTVQPDASAKTKAPVLVNTGNLPGREWWGAPLLPAPPRSTPGEKKTFRKLHDSNSYNPVLLVPDSVSKTRQSKKNLMPNTKEGTTALVLSAIRASHRFQSSGSQLLDSYDAHLFPPHQVATQIYSTALKFTTEK